MTSRPQITLADLETTTSFAPLVALGFFVRDNDLLPHIFSRLSFEKSTHTIHPQAALLDLWVSILAGCRSVSQINTRIRPDRLLAQAWGRDCFCEQSTIARVLDVCKSKQVRQLCEGVESVYRWIGRAPRHDWSAPLIIDIDLTGMLAGRQAEGSTKGYFSEKKGLTDASYAGLEPPNITRMSPPFCTLATN